MGVPNGLPDPDKDRIRRELIALVSRREARVNEFSKGRPTEWRPTTVNNPVTGLCFSPLEAWHFIQAQLQAGCEFSEVILKKPLGRKAYELSIQLEPSKRPVYIKIEPCGDRVFGRSFHYSTRESGA
jgi:hypothetical protein